MKIIVPVDGSAYSLKAVEAACDLAKAQPPSTLVLMAVAVEIPDRQGYFWKESVVNEQLETIMRSSFEDVVRYAETHHVNNRIAAYMLAIDRVAYTIRQRGIYA